MPRVHARAQTDRWLIAALDDGWRRSPLASPEGVSIGGRGGNGRANLKSRKTFSGHTPVSAYFPEALRIYWTGPGRQGSGCTKATRLSCSAAPFSCRYVRALARLLLGGRGTTLNSPVRPAFETLGSPSCPRRAICSEALPRTYQQLTFPFVPSLSSPPRRLLSIRPTLLASLHFRWMGKGVLKAVENINTIIAPALIGKDPTEQKTIDDLMLELDGTKNKGKLGANAILAVSMAVSKAGAAEKDVPLYKHISELAGNAKLVLTPSYTLKSGSLEIPTPERSLVPSNFQVLRLRP